MTRRHPLPSAAFGVVAATVAALLAACGSSSEPAEGSGKSGTITWAWDLPTSWDPVTSSNGWDVNTLNLTYASLTRLDDLGVAGPGLASEWAYEDDGRKVTFTLRDDLKFADGTVLNAEAVKKSLERARDEPKSTAAGNLENVEDITVESPLEVSLSFKKPDYQIPNVLGGRTGMIVSPTAFEKDSAGIATQPVGAGPFILKELKPDAEAVLKRNPDYWDAQDVHISDFTIKPLDGQPQPTRSALLSGAVNIAEAPVSSVDSLEKDGFDVHLIPSHLSVNLSIKTNVAPFDNPKVVDALKAAVDREALVKVVTFGTGKPAYQAFPEGYVAFDPDLVDTKSYDPARAKQLLVEAGHADGLPITIYTWSLPNPGGELLQSQLDAAGFKVTLEAVPVGQGAQFGYIDKKPDLLLDTSAGRESPLALLDALYTPGGLLNLSTVQSPAVKAAFEELRATPLESADYQAKVRAANAAAVNESGSQHVFLYSTPRLLVSSKNVKDLPYGQISQRFEGVTVDK